MVDWVCGSLGGSLIESFSQDGNGHTEMYSLHFSIVEGSGDASSIIFYSLWSTLKCWLLFTFTNETTKLITVSYKLYKFLVLNLHPNPKKTDATMLFCPHQDH